MAKRRMRSSNAKPDTRTGERAWPEHSRPHPYIPCCVPLQQNLGIMEASRGMQLEQNVWSMHGTCLTVSPGDARGMEDDASRCRCWGRRAWQQAMRRDTHFIIHAAEMIVICLNLPGKLSDVCSCQAPAICRSRQYCSTAAIIRG